ncbi:MAG: phosphoribosylamine--glycine ligase, partial [Oscillospiraceae bacterium]|nr:phosphoribosylamine--glycine ligase [Oscillospiraceae bacterium]
ESDLLDIMVSTQNGMLAAADIRWKAGASACVVMASGGYPGAYETGKHICGLDENGGMDGVFVYHAGTEICDGFRTAGGRVLGITASSDTLIGALDAAYRAVGRVTFEGAHYRKDIGSGA